MHYSKHNIKRTLLATAVTTALGATVYSVQPQAADLVFSYEAVFTMVQAGGAAVIVNSDEDPSLATGAP